MHTTILLAVFIVAGDTYSGQADIAGLGFVAFPPGQWLLEHKVTPPEKEKRPDYFVFKKSGDRLERLTFIRHAPNIAQAKASSHVDSVGDRMWNGIPLSIVKVETNEAVVFLLRKPDDWNANRLEISYVYTSKNQDSWMSHAFIRSKNGWMLIGVHSSPQVISPETIQDVDFDSRFLTPANESRNPK